MPCQDEFGGSVNFEVILDTSSQSYRQKWNVCIKFIIKMVNNLNVNSKFYDFILSSIQLHCKKFLLT